LRLASGPAVVAAIQQVAASFCAAVKVAVAPAVTIICPVWSIT